MGYVLNYVKKLGLEDLFSHPNVPKIQSLLQLNATIETI